MERRHFLKMMGVSTIAAGTYALARTTSVAASETQHHYFRGFGEDSIDSTPEDVEEAYPTDGGGLSVTVDEKMRREIDGTERCLRLQKSGTGTDGVRLTSVPNVDDCELFCVWQNEAASSLTNRLKLLARASEDEDSGVLGGSSTSEKARLAQYDSEVTIKGVAGDAIESGTEIAQRLRVVDDQAWLRVWEWGAREPRKWTLGPVDVDVTLEGGVGLFVPALTEKRPISSSGRSVLPFPIILENGDRARRHRIHRPGPLQERSGPFSGIRSSISCPSRRRLHTHSRRTNAISGIRMDGPSIAMAGLGFTVV
jgi:hypothetical protein